MTFPRNLDNFPTAFWSGADEDSIWLLAVRALHRATTVCDRRFAPDPNNSAVGLLFQWMLHENAHGPHDILSGLTLDMSCTPHSPAKPTLCAHKRHNVPFDFGFSTPYPCHLSDYNADNVNMRIELWRTNKLVASWPVAVIESMLNTSSKSRHEVSKTDN